MNEEAIFFPPPSLSRAELSKSGKTVGGRVKGLERLGRLRITRRTFTGQPIGTPSGNAGSSGALVLVFRDGIFKGNRSRWTRPSQKTAARFLVHGTPCQRKRTAAEHFRGLQTNGSPTGIISPRVFSFKFDRKFTVFHDSRAPFPARCRAN